MLQFLRRMASSVEVQQQTEQQLQEEFGHRGLTPFMDITGLQTLEEVMRDLHRRKFRVMLTDANEHVTLKLERAGLLDVLGRANFCRDLRPAASVLNGG